MPPKIDPYATPRARVFDLLLILFAILVITIMICTAPKRRSATGATNPPTSAPAAHLSVNLAAND